ncbi:hypothetical protein [Iningainema tapete]|uniref:Uncharacterized protein n=1 Tax=Iningainema tapete BLCC-T55 TaxID=2748662 RepID=A0A8J6XAD5_9CYAN|nr:hypothetical protein [Iningainema tapete]MBD2771125.1 hypothetical protein [Iningainema tapete BLCC-T55]
MPSRNKFWRKNKTIIIFGGLIAISALFSIGDMMDKGARLSQMRATITQSTFDQMQLEQNDEFSQKQANIANARMRRGCILVVDATSAKNLVTLPEGQPVKDRANKSYLPAGVTVCGANGETAVLRRNAQGVPVISEIAVGDRELVYENLKRIRGAKVYYNTPKN